MRRRLRLGGTVFLLSLALWAMAKYRETLSFFLNLYRAHRIGQAFYRNYDHVSRDVPFHPGMAPRLDVYSPVDGDEHPVLVFIHGGSWHQYHKRLFAPVAMKLLPEGMVVVIPDYTLYPGARYEQMANQVAAALSWTLDNIEQYGGDSRRVVIAGHSSGAHLAGLAVLDPRFLAPYGHAGTELCGLIGLSGVYDVQSEYDFWAAKGVTPRLIAGVMGGQAHFAAASPMSYVHADLPVLLIHGDRDTTVPLSIAQEFHTALQAAGAPSELKIYRGTGHTDYLFAALARDESRVVRDIARFVCACRPRAAPLTGAGRASR
jgi:acetyl esterase/lipase